MGGAGKNATDYSSKQVFTTGEAAEICRVSQQTIIRCFDSGRLNGFRVPGSRFRRIPRGELIRFMKENDIPIDAIEAGRRRVLIVDDDPEIIELFEDLFRRDDRFEVCAASTGYDAGSLVESFRPHIVLLDYMLPDINGDHVCRRIRERDDEIETKVVIISGVINPDEIEMLKGAGADAFVKKPFSVASLMSTITELLDMTESAESKR